MPAHSKPGIDWTAVKARFLAGESVHEIAKSYNGLITRQSIDKRAKKEGWAARALATIRRSQSLTDSRGRRTPENAQKIISLIAEGISVQKACKSVGFSETTFRSWLEADQDFDAEFHEAKLQWERERVANIARAEGRGDWKASAYRLENHESTRSEYQPKPTGGGGVTVVLNIPDPAPVVKTINPTGTIDHE